jgi:hypothetical protein
VKHGPAAAPTGFFLPAVNAGDAKKSRENILRIP